MPVLAALAGTLLGCLTGLLPGVHVNLLLAVMASSGFSFFQGGDYAAFVVALALSHSISGIIPSVFLAAPNSDNLLSALPGHRLLLEGKGLRAVHASVFGAASASVLSLLLSPAILFLVVAYKPVLEAVTPFLLLAALSLSVLTEESKRKKFMALGIAACSGLLGMLSVSSSWGFEPLFPVFTGMFALAPLARSAFSSTPLPVQSIEPAEMDSKGLLLPSVKGVLGGALIGFIPAVGPAQAGFLFSFFQGFNSIEYLAFISSVVVSSAFFNFHAASLFGEAHSGAAVFLLNEFPGAGVEFLSLAALSSAFLACFFALAASRRFLQALNGVDYSVLNASILAFLLALVLRLSGPLGLALSLLSAFLGYAVLASGVKRINLLSFLSVPTIAFHLWL